MKDIQQKRFFKFEEWLKNNNFDNLMYRLTLEHNIDYRESCYHKGLEPYPNRKLNFILNYISEKYNPITLQNLENDFPNSVWEFKGYYFQKTWGYGEVVDVYNKDDFTHLIHL